MQSPKQYVAFARACGCGRPRGLREDPGGHETAAARLLWQSAICGSTSKIFLMRRGHDARRR